MLDSFFFSFFLSKPAPLRINCVHSCTNAANISETTMLLPTISGKYFKRIGIGFTAAFNFG